MNTMEGLRTKLIADANQASSPQESAPLAPKSPYKPIITILIFLVLGGAGIYKWYTARIEKQRQEQITAQREKERKEREKTAAIEKAKSVHHGPTTTPTDGMEVRVRGWYQNHVILADGTHFRIHSNPRMPNPIGTSSFVGVDGIKYRYTQINTDDTDGGGRRLTTTEQTSRTVGASRIGPTGNTPTGGVPVNPTRVPYAPPSANSGPKSR